jgi:putative acetyltransferase
MRIHRESPNQRDVIALIESLDAYQDSLYPAEARYALDLSSLSSSDVLFVVARNAENLAIGCGAVVLCEAYGELKRMYVRPENRGQGAARQILTELETEAVLSGCRELMLETGPYQPEALRFYERSGYTRRGPFGSYPDHPLSVFMAKAISPNDASSQIEV